MHHPLLAWLPFLAALVVAFGAGVAFARLNEGLAGAGTHARRGGIFRLVGGSAPIATGLVALLLATSLVWLVAAAVMHVR